jgi:hypothetical protein
MLKINDKVPDFEAEAFHGGEIKNIKSTPLNGQEAVGIYAYNDNGTVNTITVTNCSIHDFSKAGIVLSGSNAVVSVYSCTVTGGGPLGLGYDAQNGIQIGFGAGGEVVSNTVSGAYYTGPSWSASGILGTSSTALTVAGNVVWGCQGGLQIYDVTEEILNYDIFSPPLF